MADKIKVRLTIRPDEDWEVGEDEIPGLRHQGLLVEDEPEPDTRAAEYQVALKRGAEERARAAKTGKGASGQDEGK